MIVLAVGILILLFAPVALIVVIVLATQRRQPGGPLVPGASLRRFFQYFLAAGLVLTVAIAASVAGALVVEGIRSSDRETLVGAVTTVIVGGLLLLGVGWWIARDLRRTDPTGGWRGYLALIGLLALTVAAVGTGQVLDAALAGRVAGVPMVVAAVWLAVWLSHRWLEHATVPVAERATHLFLGSLGGLIMLTWGAVLTLGALGRVVAADDVLLVGGSTMLTTGLAVLVVGLAVWAVHWFAGYRSADRRPAWLVLVLPVGVGGGTVLAVFGTSRVLYQALVWVLGETAGSTAGEHFATTPTALAAVVVGAGLIWYHRVVLGGGPVTAEVDRVHRYLVSGLSLAAAATGVGMLAAAGVGTLRDRPLFEPASNAPLAALTLLAVAGPLWWFYWGRIRRSLAADPLGETGSATRRVYLVILFGVLAVVAAVAVLVTSVMLVQGLAGGDEVGAALGSVRVPLGVLVAAGTVAWYHGTVFRVDRARLRRATSRMAATGTALQFDPDPAPAPNGPPPPPPDPARIILVGRPDAALSAAVAGATGSVVETWAGDHRGPWDAESVLAALAPLQGADVVLVVSEEDGPRARAARPSA